MRICSKTVKKKHERLTTCIRNSGFIAKPKVCAFNKSQCQTEKEVLLNPCLQQSGATSHTRQPLAGIVNRHSEHINMAEQLKFFLSTLAKFDEAELNKVCSYFKRKVVKKNTILLNEGQICTEFYYIKKGCMRTFFITKQGSEKTRLINIDCSIGTAFASFVSQSPSFELIEVLEDTELFAIGYKDFYKLLNEIIHWRDFYQKMLEMAYTYQNQKIGDLVTLTAKQRYDKVLKNNPMIVQRVSNKVLASYIDVREETLSRIKRK